LDEKFVPAHLALAIAYQTLADHQNAVIEFRRILELDSSHREAKLEMGKYFLQAGSQDPENYSKAREFAEELLESNPGDPQARILLGNAYAGLNDLEGSIDEMMRVLEENPGNLVAQVNLGVFQLTLRDTAKAEETFLEALRQHPESVAVQRAAGNFYTVTRDFTKAEHHFRQAFELDQEDMTSLYSLVRFCLVTQQADKAEEVFKEAISANPDLREPKWGLANFHIAREKTAQGLEMLGALLEEDPGDRITKIRLAEVYLTQNEEEKAEDLVRSLLEVNPNDPEAHHLKGRLFLTQNNPDAALEEFNKAIQLKDGLVPTYLQKASLLLARREYAEAQEALNKVLSSDKNNIGAQAGIAKIMALTRQPENALQRANAVLEIRSNNVDALFAQGEAYLMLQRLDLSEAAFEKLRDIEPENPFHLHRLGYIKLQKDNESEALSFFKEALKMNPDLTDVMNDIIYLHMKDRHFENALEEVKLFLKNSSKPDVAHVFKGKIFMAQGNHSQAEKDFRKAIALNKGNYQAYILLGQLYLQQDNLEQAIREVDQLLAEDDTLGPAHLLKAYYLDRSNDVPGAIEHYRRTLQLNAENPIAANNLAWIYGQNDQNLEEALGLASGARRRDPDNPEYADTLGWIHYKMNNYTLAVDQLLFSVNNGQPKAGNYYRLGMAYYGKGDKILSKQTLRKAIELEESFPGREEAQNILREL
jgi:tetratricopeptide (TPR) repeat protein